MDAIRYLCFQAYATEGDVSWNPIDSKLFSSFLDLLNSFLDLLNYSPTSNQFKPVSFNAYTLTPIRTAR